MSNPEYLYRPTYTFKILVLGDAGVGKTSIIKKYTRNIFSPNYKTTIGADFDFKIINLDKANVNLIFWDIAGQERFGKLLRVYFREASAVILVVDITRMNTINNIKYWLEQIKLVEEKENKNLPIILFANKIDIIDINICKLYSENNEKNFNNFMQMHENLESTIVLKKFIDDNVFIDLFFTSAKNNINIIKGINEVLLIKMMENPDLYKINESYDNKIIQLSETVNEKSIINDYFYSKICCN